MLQCKNRQRLILLSILSWVFIVFGCSSAGIELIAKDISNVEVLIDQARQEQAETYAPLELKLAEENLQEAKDALKDDEPETASRKAEMAREHARVADAKSRAEKAKKLTENEKKDLDILRNEIDRAQKTKE